MEIVNIPLPSIIPNTYNPNEVSENIMVQLKKNIQRDGFLQPLILRKHPTMEGKYEIIDGEHRFKIVSQLGYADVPSIIVEKTDDLARVATINMNQLRGSFNIIKLADVLISLKKTYSAEEIEDLLGYTAEELQSYEDIKNFQPISEEELQDLSDIDTDTTPEVDKISDYNLGFALAEQRAIIDGAIKRIEGTPAESLTQICQEYLTNQPLSESSPDTLIGINKDVI